MTTLELNVYLNGAQLTTIPVELPGDTTRRKTAEVPKHVTIALRMSGTVDLVAPNAEIDVIVPLIPADDEKTGKRVSGYAVLSGPLKLPELRGGIVTRIYDAEGRFLRYAESGDQQKKPHDAQ